MARSALEELWRIEEQWAKSQLNLLGSLPSVYLVLGDEAGAKKALQAIVKAAGRLYAIDTDANDPNRAFKGNWPSVALWTVSVEVAAKLSLASAEEILGSIPDPDIIALEGLELARSLLGTQAGRLVISSCHKHQAFSTLFADSRSP